MSTTETGSIPAGRGRRRPRSRLLVATSGKFGALLLALVALMAATPLIIEGPDGNALLGIFSGAVMVAGLRAARPGRRAIVLGLMMTLADITAGRCALIFGSRALVLLQIALWLATLTFVTATILDVIFESEVVTLETLQASLCVYLLLGLIGAFGFALIENLHPGSFRAAGGPGIDWLDDRSRAIGFLRLFVFSYGTLSGAGYGGLAPATGFANNAASLEALCGQIYLAVVIARLVGLHAAHRAG